jgi:pimeloyl-ACP methyl ester carboxylesterase
LVRLRLVRFAAAGHAAHLETPERFASELDAFLGELGDENLAALAQAQ